MKNKTCLVLILSGLFLLTVMSFMDTVKADPPNNPYDHIYAPGSTAGHGFGKNYVKLVNMSFFKNMFQTHTNWNLEYKRYSYSSWADGSAYLTIERTWDNSGFWKFNLILNVPVNIYSARFTFGVDINCLQYVERSGTEIWINYTANATEIYCCMFNWSDIVNIPNLIITKGISDGRFWFRFQKDNILSGNHVFDPTFGISSIGLTSASTENVVVSSSNYRSYVANDGIPRSISVYLEVTTASHKVKCGLYYSNCDFFAFTEERIIPVGTAWQTFNFSIGTYILLKTQDYYFFSVWSNATLGDCRSYGTFVDVSVTYRDSETYTTNFPSPIDTTVSGTYTLSAYCTYTYLVPLSVSSMYPVNNSYAYKNVTVSFIVNHTGGRYNVLFYKKVGSNPYFLVFTKNNVLNDTYYSRFFNATALNVLYSWKVCLKNASVPYWKNTTYQFYIKFSNNTLITVNNNINVTGSSSYIWDNSIGFTVTNAFVGIKTPFLWHNNTVNITGLKQLKSFSNGYHLYDNQSGITTPVIWHNNTHNTTGINQIKLFSNGLHLYVNLSGTTTPFTYHNNTVNVSSVKQLKLLSNGYHLWDNSSSGVMSYTSFVNCSGTLQKAWYSALGKFKVWANMTGNGTTVNLHETIVNATGTHVKVNRVSGIVDVYANYTGNKTPITLYQSIVNATGSHTLVDNSTGYYVTASYTGDTTPISIVDTKKNVTGSTTKTLDGTGYHVTSTHESIVNLFENLVNVTGTHQKQWTGSAWKVYANYSGNGSSCPSCNSTNLTINEFLTNCTGGYTSYYNSSGGWVVNNTYTGNMSVPGNLTGNYTMSLNFTGFNGYIVWSGDHIENNTNISFPVTSNMSINGSVHVDEDSYFLSGMLSFDPAVMILSLFFGFFYIGYESKKRSGGFFMLFAGFLLIALGILVYGMLGYAAVLVVPFAIFIMLLGGKKAFYGPETEESQNNKSTK